MNKQKVMGRFYSFLPNLQKHGTAVSNKGDTSLSVDLLIISQFPLKVWKNKSTVFCWLVTDSVMHPVLFFFLYISLSLGPC